MKYPGTSLSSSYEEVDCQRPHFKPSVFLMSIKSEANNRTYIFAPTAQTKFMICVSLPILDFDRGPKLLITADDANPMDVKNAITFVERNEAAFVEACYQSREQPTGKELFQPSNDVFLQTEIPS